MDAKEIPTTGIPIAGVPTTANAITNTLLVRINERYQPRCLMFRLNVMLMRASRGVVRSAPNGCPDLIGTILGHGVAIEVKAGRDRMNPAQERFAAQWVRSGGIHIVARDVERAMKDLGDALCKRL